jgi:hypothetical protein
MLPRDKREWEILRKCTVNCAEDAGQRGWVAEKGMEEAMKGWAV